MKKHKPTRYEPNFERMLANGQLGCNPHLYRIIFERYLAKIRGELT